MIPRWPNLGRFRVESLLGQGGMGTVWAAYDPELHRSVAVKVLRREDSRSVARFVREARAQAAINHPGVCPVYEVGQCEIGPYIVMQRLDGRPLDEVCAELPLEARLVLMRDVAEAVHAAHRGGLIHRDLKPSNVLVETPPEGPPKAYVVDFGLARISDATLTQEGDPMGTPAYMAPEQIRGDDARIDRRTDIYALGATLYRVLTGRLPFPGWGNALLVDALTREPDPLQPLGIPWELEAITLKCLEKEPERRYASARALAEDLDRYLDGRPVLARPAGRAYRLGKWVWRHRALVAVLAVSAALLLLALAWGATTAWRAKERERLTRTLTERVEAVAAQVRYSHLAPLHDARPDRELLRRQLEVVRGEMERAGAAGRGLGLRALGQGALALGELDAAWRHLEAAWQAGERGPETAAAIAQAASALYRERIADLELVGDWGGRQRELERLEARYGAAARRFLVLGQAAGGQPDPLTTALGLFHQGRFAAALELLTQDAQQPAWAYEVPRLEGDVRRAWAVQQSAAGDDEAARAELDRALAAYARAAGIAASDPDLRLAAAQASYLRLSLDLPGGVAAGIRFDAAQEHADRALAILPDDPRGFLWKARLHRLKAQRLRERAEDPTTALERALAAAQRGIELAPPGSAVLSSLRLEEGRAEWGWAQWLAEKAQDPAERLTRATAAFDQVAPSQRNYPYWTAVASAWMTLGDDRATRSEPALPAYRRAVLGFRAAAAEHSAPFAAQCNRGLVLLKASALPEVADPMPLLAQAVRSFRRARAVKPDHPLPFYNLGRCHLRLAQAGDPASGRLDAGPPGSLQRAEESYLRALALAPDMFAAHNALGELYHLRAIDAWARSGDGAAAEPLFLKARASFARGLAAAPGHPILLLNLAWTAYFQGKVRVRAGQDPAGFLDEARELCQQVLAAVDDPAARLCQGSAHRLAAESAVAAGRDPSATLAAAAQAFQELIAANARHAEAHRSLGRLYTLEAEWRMRTGGDPEPAFLRAREALDHALALEPGPPADFPLALARWCLARARWRQAVGEAAAALIDEGLAALALARGQHPDRDEVRVLAAAFEELKARR